MAKERPIIMTGDSVKGILADTKTQTRRVIKPQPPDGYKYKGISPNPLLAKDAEYLWMDGYACWRPKCCPYGKVGDRLWVKETCLIVLPKGIGEVIYRADCDYKDSELSPIKPGNVILKWRSSRFMPRWASRILLEITEVRVERVQEISRDDVLAEGIFPFPYHNTGDFEDLWDSLNAKRGYGWEINPWVWVISFRRMKL